MLRGERVARGARESRSGSLLLREPGQGSAEGSSDVRLPRDFGAQLGSGCVGTGEGSVEHPPQADRTDQLLPPAAESRQKQTVSGDRELDLHSDRPELVLGFADVHSLVPQRGACGTAGSSLSELQQRSEPCPGPHLRPGMLRRWGLAGCHGLAKLAPVRRAHKLLSRAPRGQEEWARGLSPLLGHQPAAGRHLEVALGKHPGPCVLPTTLSSLTVDEELSSFQPAGNTTWLKPAGHRLPVLPSPSDPWRGGALDRARQAHAVPNLNDHVPQGLREVRDSWRREQCKGAQVGPTLWVPTAGSVCSQAQRWGHSTQAPWAVRA